ncbi:MAG TPA: class I SAM-dependent methyltransferase [Candidatus Krumholzibacteria bacterium]|nr:class I SAM-dependent methyltransferase [Candidatus Krumholzibacteria bacterium]
MDPQASTPAAPVEPAARTAARVAEFYERLIFPSRRSHPEYAGLVAVQPGQRVGDFGCGQSLFYGALRRHQPPPVFLDLSMSSLRTIDYGLRVRADLNRLPFPDGVYDRILCIGVLHHLPEREKALCEMARLLSPSGTLVLGVYAPGSLQSHLRRLHQSWSASPWRALLLRATAFLILARYRARGNSISAREAMTRARDFLQVPFVRYAAPDSYAAEAAPAGLRLQERDRIAAMNILVFRRS